MNLIWAGVKKELGIDQKRHGKSILKSGYGEKKKAENGRER